MARTRLELRTTEAPRQCGSNATTHRARWAALSEHRLGRGLQHGNLLNGPLRDADPSGTWRCPRLWLAAAVSALFVLTGCSQGCGAAAAECVGADGTTLTVGPLTARVAEISALRGDGTRERVELDALQVQCGPTSDELSFRVEVPGLTHAVAIVLDGLPFDGLIQNGWQSWSFAGQVAVPRFVVEGADGLPAFAEARSGDPIDVEYGVSYTAAVLGDLDGVGSSLVAGALTSHNAVTGFGAVAQTGEHAQLTMVYGAAREPLPRNGDGVTSTEPLWLHVNADAGAGLVRLGEAMVAAGEGAVEARDRPVAPKRPPGGWYSWNEHLADITPEILRGNLEAARDHLLPAGLTLFEIDDGWARAWGDWQPNDKFPDGMGMFAADAAAAGLVPGIWLAPFLVEDGSAAADALPEAAFVHTATGGRLVHELFGNPRTLFVVDTTSPEGLEHIRASVTPLVDAGFRFFKLDFLYAAALPGARAKDVTGTRALREGLMTIRDVIGTDAFINGCGTPIGPVLGLVDSLRVGADITFGAVSYDFIVYAARELAARRFVFPLTWPDADQFLLRSPRTLDEARVGAAMVALAGPAYSFGDDLVLLEADRRALGLAPDLLAMRAAEAPAVPLLFDGRSSTTSTNVYGNPALEALDNGGRFDGVPPTQWRVGPTGNTTRSITFDWLARKVEGL